jgi:hypothetical protein
MSAFAVSRHHANRVIHATRGANNARATDLMKRLVKAASPLGLYAEEFDVETGRHLGNFPQAFSHLARVEAAARIVVAEAWRKWLAELLTFPSKSRITDDDGSSCARGRCAHVRRSGGGRTGR